MSELSIQNFVQTKINQKNLKILSNSQYQSHENPPSRLWLQYSEPNLKTPKSNGLSWKGNSQQLDLSNNFNIKDSEQRNSQTSSEFKSNIQRRLKYESQNNEQQNNLRSNYYPKVEKQQILQATKYGIGKSNQKGNQISLHQKAEKSAYEGRDLVKSQRKYEIKLDKSYKQNRYCFCTVM